MYHIPFVFDLAFLVSYFGDVRASTSVKGVSVTSQNENSGTLKLYNYIKAHPVQKLELSMTNYDGFVYDYLVSRCCRIFNGREPKREGVLGFIDVGRMILNSCCTDCAKDINIFYRRYGSRGYSSAYDSTHKFLHGTIYICGNANDCKSEKKEVTNITYSEFHIFTETIYKPKKIKGLKYAGQLLTPQIPWLTLLCWLLHVNFPINDIKFPLPLKSFDEATNLVNEFKIKVLEIQMCGKYDEKQFINLQSISKELEVALNPVNECFMFMLERMISEINETSNENTHLKEKKSSSFILLCVLLYNLPVEDCFAIRKKILLEQHYELLSTVTLVEVRNELPKDSWTLRNAETDAIWYLQETDEEEQAATNAELISGDTIALEPNLAHNNLSKNKKAIRYQKNISLLIDSFNAYKKNYLNSEAYDTIDGAMFFDNIGRVKPSD